MGCTDLMTDTVLKENNIICDELKNKSEVA